MPTLKPRVSITLDQSEILILDRYAAASGTPRASILADLIRVTLPQLGEAADLIEMANAAPRHIKQGLVENLSNATADAMGFLQPFNADYAKVMRKLQKELNLGQPSKTGARVQRASAGGARGGKNPHSLTGGSKS
jgi:hypothetical protein